MKVMTVVGTRPELIRLSRVLERLDRSVEHILVHTGQNYDFELNEIFFNDLGIRKPDHFLAVDTSTLGRALGDILARTEEVLRAERPDAFMILGDTNSALAAIMARRLRVPVYHLEAGNRCFDFNVPEEINRRLVDHVSDFNLVYTEHARRHLLAEGLQHRRVHLIGSPMAEVLDHYADRIAASTILDELQLKAGGYFIASIHREENVDDPANLRRLLASFEALHARFGKPVVVSTHPRTRARLEAMESAGRSSDALQFLKPFGFFDYNALQKKAFCAISDSGTIAEEAAILGFPAVTPRNAMERPEALDTGSVILSGLTPEGIVEGVSTITRQFAESGPPPCPHDYTPLNTSQRVVNLMVGTARLSNAWWGVHMDPLGRGDGQA